MKIEHEALGVASSVVHTAALTINKIHGYGRGAADRWLQLHDAKARPADTAVPLRVWPLYAAAPFGEDLPTQISCANGAVFVVSSTEATLTYDAATVIDIFVNGESPWDNTGTSVAGDYTTADEVLQVWADSAGPKRLVRLEASDAGVGSGGVFVQVHAGDTPANATLVASFPLADSAEIDVFFGDGLWPYRRSGSTVYDGCTVAVSSTQNEYTALSSNIASIKATYK